jgi:hypothetical protein
MRFVSLLLLLLACGACGASVRPATPARTLLAADAGLSRAQIDEVVAAHVPAVRACYEERAKAEGRPMGVVRVGWRIDPAGTVSNVEIVSTSLHSSGIEGCITSAIASWTFPAAARPTAVTEHPFTF